LFVDQFSRRTLRQRSPETWRFVERLYSLTGRSGDHDDFGLDLYELRAGASAKH